MCLVTNVKQLRCVWQLSCNQLGKGCPFQQGYYIYKYIVGWVKVNYYILITWGYCIAIGHLYTSALFTHVDDVVPQLR